MTNNKTEILGAKEIEAALRNFGPMLQGKKGYPQNMLRNAARAMAKKSLDNAKIRAPVDTGRLRNSLMIKLLSTTYRDQITAKGHSTELYYLGYNAGTSRDDPNGAWYAGAVEVGPYNRPAEPFMRPAVEQHTTQLTNIFQDNMSASIKKVAAKLEREGYKP